MGKRPLRKIIFPVKLPVMSDETTEPFNPMRAVRHALGMTQEEMAQEIKCSWATIRNSERDARLPRSKALRANFALLAKRAGIEMPPEVNL